MRTLVPTLAEHLGIPDQELLEKGVRLHLLLGSLPLDASAPPSGSRATLLVHMLH